MVDQEWLLSRIEYGPGGCWLWVGYVNPRTHYAQHRKAGKDIHRLAYELFIGPIPEGAQLDHAKGCPKHCVNPYTLTPVNRDMNARLVFRRRWGQMPRRDLRVSRWLHQEVTRRLNDADLRTPV